MTHMNEVRIWEDLSLGDIYILDYSEVNLSYVKKATPQFFKKLDFICEEVWNNQIKELHIINASSAAEVIIALLRKYLYRRLRDKVFVHESLTDLYKVVPREILPKEYGGDEKSLNDLKDSWYKTLQKHRSRFEKLENMKVQENRRPSACKNCDILGYYADTMITFFLVYNNFSIEKTKQSLDMYYSVKTIIPDIYQNTLPFSSTVKSVYEELTFVPLPNLTPNLQNVVFARLNGDPEKLVGELSVVIMTHINEVKIWEGLSLGDIYIFDFSNEIWNNQIKEMHVINASSTSEALIALMRKFIYKDLKEKIFVHESLADLYKVVPREILPKEYGGNEKSLDELKDLWYATIQKHRPRFEELENMVVNEDRRPNPCKNCDILGYYGNYMRIDVN
ncbi:unnamed protein product [Diabrotica balteata]|uniref:CRAL-TRIO domain-containing protein n=1 Tax=Diabrotica balteata TaxID=107213 RepID=A0A9N9T1M8_DIABA|nr:unnamed protein product [Diabrotica balteata]